MRRKKTSVMPYAEVATDWKDFGTCSFALSLIHLPPAQPLRWLFREGRTNNYGFSISTIPPAASIASAFFRIKSSAASCSSAWIPAKAVAA